MTKPKKCIQIKDGVWWYKGKFVFRYIGGRGEQSFMVFSKYEREKGKNFLFEAGTSKDLYEGLEYFSEIIEMPISEDIACDTLLKDQIND